MFLIDFSKFCDQRGQIFQKSVRISIYFFVAVCVRSPSTCDDSCTWDDRDKIVNEWSNEVEIKIFDDDVTFACSMCQLFLLAGPVMKEFANRFERMDRVEERATEIPDYQIIKGIADGWLITNFES